MLYDSVESLVGHTPLVRLSRAARALGAPDRLFGKLEFMNPTGSAKDRPALFMIEAAERSGALRPGGVIIEPTSGNTGIGLAAIGAARGIRRARWLFVSIYDSYNGSDTPFGTF